MASLALPAWIAALPAVDGHLHPPLRGPQPTDHDGWLRLFTESDAAAQLPHVAHTLYFQQALRAVAALHGCEPTIEAILAARQALPLDVLLARSVGAAQVRALLVDDGYRPAASYTLAELRAAAPAGCQVWGVLRIETLVERLAAEHATFAAFAEAFAAALGNLRAQGYVALKSIAAYRCGLALHPADTPAAAARWPRLHALARAGALRLVDQPVIEWCLWRASAAAREQGLPLQLHTGFGDRDLDLPQANPLLLRPALEAGALRGVPVVLLHTYPYVREAAYLASLYPEVYLDLSLAVPLVGPAATRVVGEALELAPASKLLYGSDAAGLAETIWLAARAMRGALAELAAGWVQAGALTPAQAEQVAARVLGRNAAALYALPAP
jgi:predicted TIM-barrel fold metal-dependent hydrolase